MELARWRSALLDYNVTFEHRAGKALAFVDYSSRDPFGASMRREHGSTDTLARPHAELEDTACVSACAARACVAPVSVSTSTCAVNLAAPHTYAGDNAHHHDAAWREIPLSSIAEHAQA